MNTKKEIIIVKPIPSKAALAAIFVGFSLFAPEYCWALQTHSSPEGLIAHQLAHVLFGMSMAVLAYWLESNNFVIEKGWKRIQISCVLFLLWNVVAFTGHFVESRLASDLITGPKGSWNQRLIVGDEPYAWAYYFLKLDHLICVPAILFLFLGIRSLYMKSLSEAATIND